MFRGTQLFLALSMRKWTATLFLMMSTLSVMAQNSFAGSLEYNISNIDFLTKDTIDGKLFIYARDSLVRISYLFSDGKNQETIHHLSQHKMLSLIEVEGQFFAIQIKDTASSRSAFTYHKKLAWRKIATLNCRQASVSFSKGTLLLYYFKKIDARYFVGFNNAPGLPIKGQIPTENGMMTFDLQKIDYRTPPQSLFMPDKKYKVMGLDAFIQWSKGQ